MNAANSPRIWQIAFIALMIAPMVEYLLPR